MSDIIPQVYKTQPFTHQHTGFTNSWDKEYYGLFMEMGTGKSKIVIDTMAALYKTNKIVGALILAPKGVYLNWVKNEIPIHLYDDVIHRVFAWSSTMNRKQIDEADTFMKGCAGLDILVMNIEALVSERAYDYAMEFLKSRRCITIIDESTCIKNPQAIRTKKCFILSKMSAYRRIMTGTPITQSPLDLFSQTQFLKPGALGFTSFTAFRAYYAQMVTMTFGFRSFPKVVGYRNLEKLQRDVQTFSYRILKKECLDLPDKVYQSVYVEMTPEQRSVYERLRDEAVVALEGGDITTMSAITTIMKLQQIACGHVRRDDGTEIDLPHNRLNALDEILEELPADSKVIIWCNFKRDVVAVFEHLDGIDDGDGSKAVHYYGDTTDPERAEALERFHNDPKCRFFIGTPGTGGRGLTLVEAATTIYYSNGYNLEHRLQSEDRNHRIGQTQKVTVIDITCVKTVDERIVKLLRAKQDLATLVLDTWREMLLL